MSKGFCLEVTGDYACFTRPEMKVERVSYDVITPSAARAIFDAILWKPAIRWRITKIEVLNPIRWTNIRRNEVASVASPKSQGIFIEDVRQQRAGLILRDVRYRLYGEFDFIPPEKRGKTPNPVPEWLADSAEVSELRKPDIRPDETEAKYAAMFERRARKGQHFHQPYLGCREFAADVRLVDPVEEPAAPIPKDANLGWMLYDLDFSDPANIKPMFFRPEMKQGVIAVPQPESEEVRK
ncbi:MAG TPA: type I-C CRISPR-associated protein Cas5c [Kiritimatiellia bacterium]|nr:type I-C CRISPR-associated protein Cas5c [Kiritimatiellia bacterium]